MLHEAKYLLAEVKTPVVKSGIGIETFAVANLTPKVRLCFISMPYLTFASFVRCFRKGALEFVLNCVVIPLIYWELFAECFDFFFDAVFDVCVSVFAVLCETVDHLDDPITDLAELLFAKAAGCGGWRSKTNT